MDRAIASINQTGCDMQMRETKRTGGMNDVHITIEFSPALKCSGQKCIEPLEPTVLLNLSIEHSQLIDVFVSHTMGRVIDRETRWTRTKNWEIEEVR